MTLIVARIIENNIHILCDSKVTDLKGGKNNHVQQASLKTIILHPYVCLSFAGIISYAEEALNIFFIKILKILIHY